MTTGFTTCSGCGRLLRDEDGPTGPECLELPQTAGPAVEGPENVPPPAPVQDVVLQAIDGHQVEIPAQ